MTTNTNWVPRKHVRSSIQEHTLDKTCAFLEGALNLAISVAYDRETGTAMLAFPSASHEGGWFPEPLDFPTVEDAVMFVDKVRHLIDIGRQQARGE